MSWLARSIANTLLIDDDDNDEDEARHSSGNDAVHGHNHDEQGKVDLDLKHRLDHSEEDYDKSSYNDDNDDDDDDDDSNNLQGRGVKDDLSEFTETLSRQLWGVASFLAPPPPPPPPLPAPLTTARKVKSVPSENEVNGDEEGFEEDVENLSAYEEDRVVEEAVGITEEALAFAQNIAHHPETWLDFPLAEEEDFEDFEISDIQHKHALAIEHLVPRLAALRIEFCPVHMNDGYFWMVYFVLLFSRLNKLDAGLLSTPQLVQARAMWMQELQKRTKAETDWFGRKTFYSQESMHSPREHLDPNLSEDSHPRYWYHTPDATEPRPHDTTTDFSSDKHSAEGNEVHFTNNSVEDPSGESEKLLLAGPSSNVLLQDYDDDDDDGDDWLEDTAELEGYSATGIVGNEEDVSFSDLEEDSNWTMPVKPK